MNQSFNYARENYVVYDKIRLNCWPNYHYQHFVTFMTNNTGYEFLRRTANSLESTLRDKYAN